MPGSARLGLLGFSLLAWACTDTGPVEPPNTTGGNAGASSAAGAGKGGNGSSGGGSGGTAGNATGGSSGAGSNAGGAGGAAGSGKSAGGGAGRDASGGAGARGGAAGDGQNSSGGASGGSAEGGAESAGETGDGGGSGTRDPGGLPGFTLAVIGSSTAAGEGATSASRGWVSLLSNSLEDAVTGSFSARNLAVGGYTTSNLLPDSGSSGSVSDAIELEPNLIIVALAGSNDLSNGVSTSTFLARLGTIRDAAVDAGIPIFFLSTAPKDLSDEEQQTLADWANDMGDAFSTCWTPNDATYTPCFVDVFDALANSSLGIAEEYGAGDGIHLNDAGHARIFDLTLPVVRAYVCSMTACN